MTVMLQAFSLEQHLWNVSSKRCELHSLEITLLLLLNSSEVLLNKYFLNMF